MNYFAHPQAEYFGLARIDEDQALDYAARKGMTLGEWNAGSRRT